MFNLQLCERAFDFMVMQTMQIGWMGGSWKEMNKKTGKIEDDDDDDDEKEEIGCVPSTSSISNSSSTEVHCKMTWCFIVVHKVRINSI